MEEGKEITKLKGSRVLLKGFIPEVGEIVPDFTFVKSDMNELSLYDMKESNKVIISIPSVDTGICAMETKKFNEEIGKRKDAVCIAISKDLPFALKRFCGAEGIENVITGSDFRYNDFGNELNVEMVNGPLKNLLARAVFVLDKEHRIQYLELVEDITYEPNYDKALEALDALK